MAVHDGVESAEMALDYGISYSDADIQAVHVLRYADEFAGINKSRHIFAGDRCAKYYGQ